MRGKMPDGTIHAASETRQVVPFLAAQDLKLEATLQLRRLRNFSGVFEL